MNNVLWIYFHKYLNIIYDAFFESLVKNYLINDLHQIEKWTSLIVCSTFFQP